MGMIEMFRRVAFAQTLLGLITYAVAEQSPAMVLAAGTLAMLSWYVVEGPGGRPLPRWIINVGVISATAWLFYSQLPSPQGRPPLIVGLGEFIMCMIIFKLYERKNNRDWAQLMVLSMMQIICALIISAEVLFGVLVIVYLLLTLFAVLLFQLKMGHEEVSRINEQQTPRGHKPVVPKPVVTRGHRRHFNSLTMVSGFSCVSVAIVFFLLLPRGSGMGMLGDWQMHGQVRSSGFTDKLVHDPEGGRIHTSRLPVMNLSLWRDGKALGTSDYESLLIRGIAQDKYDPATRTWSRSPAATKFDRQAPSGDPKDPPKPVRLVDFSEKDMAQAIEQRYTLRAATKGVLFSIYPPLQVYTPEARIIIFNPYDQVLESKQAEGGGGAQFTVWSLPPESTADVSALYLQKWKTNPAPARPPQGKPGGKPAQAAPPAKAPAAAPKPAAVAPRPAAAIAPGAPGAPGVPGAKGGGPGTAQAPKPARAAPHPAPAPVAKPGPVRAPEWNTYARGPVLPPQSPDGVRLNTVAETILETHVPRLERDPTAQSTPQDHAIAQAVAEYLQNRCTYTLDLPRIGKAAEPITSFLIDNKAGHCEYFASAMCALLRHMGIRARVVMGFRASEYNSLGDYFIIRDKHAHAWVEVWRDDAGWKTFDPSPQKAVAALHQPPGGWLLSPVRDLYEWVEFKWLDKVINYNTNQRQTVMVSIDHNLTAVTDWLKKVREKIDVYVNAFREQWRWGVWGYLLLFAIVLLIVSAILGLMMFFVRRRRVIRQLQLAGISRRMQKQLARHLEFYLQMLRLLEKAGFTKPLWQTPASFASQLQLQNASRFAPVVPLTDLFYEIRFGARPLDADRSHKIQSHLDTLKQTI